jgi:hypothetical protein
MKIYHCFLIKPAANIICKLQINRLYLFKLYLCKYFRIYLQPNNKNVFVTTILYNNLIIKHLRNKLN